MRLWDVSIAATAIQCLRPLRRRPRVRQRVPQKNLARISQVAALRVVAFAQTFRKRIRQVVPGLGRLTIEEANHRNRRLLRPRRQRPCGRRTAEQRDEIAPLQLLAHSITSSARASTVCGISKSSALAVLRLITVSYLTGACT